MAAGRAGKEEDVEEEDAGGGPLPKALKSANPPEGAEITSVNLDSFTEDNQSPGC